MNSIKILTSIHHLPSVDHRTTLLTRNIAKVFKKNFNVKIYWLVYKPNKIEKTAAKDEIILDINDYNNGLEIIDEVEPDVIIDHEPPSLIDFTLNFAGNYRNKISVTRMDKEFLQHISSFRKIRAYFSKFFHSSIQTDTSKSEKKPLRRGLFLVYKFWFLFRTLKACNFSFFQRISLILLIFKIQFFPKRPFYDSRFENDIHWLPSDEQVETMIEKGYHKENIFVIGSPVHDTAFEFIKKNKPIRTTHEKIQVLYFPAQIYEVGIWTRQERDYNFQQIVKQITNQDDMSLTVKIHPTAQMLYEYKELLHDIDPTVPIHQSGDISQFLNDADVVISNVSLSFVLVHTLILQKPMVLCDFFNALTSKLINHELALRVNEPAQIVPQIKSAYDSNPAADSGKTEAFLKKYFYSVDGKSSERLCNIILQKIEEKKNNY